MKMSMLARSRQASMAAEPVSPEVAPTIVTRWPRWASTWSNSRPSSCSAMSLKASVGPWNSSISHSPLVELFQRRHGLVAEAGIGLARQAVARVWSSLRPATKGRITR
jgi:hypothetical protein